MVEIRDIVDEFDVDELKEMVRECIAWNGTLESYDWYDNDEYFFNDYFSNTMDAVRAVCYGSYNYTDEYVRFDGYGDLESFDNYDLERELEDNAEEIIEQYVDIIDNVYDCDLKQKVEELLEPKMTKEEVYEELRTRWNLCNNTTIRDVKKAYKELTGLDNLSIGKMIDYLYNHALMSIYTDGDVDGDVINEIKEELKLED